MSFLKTRLDEFEKERIRQVLHNITCLIIDSKTLRSSFSFLFDL